MSGKFFDGAGGVWPKFLRVKSHEWIAFCKNGMVFWFKDFHLWKAAAKNRVRPLPLSQKMQFKGMFASPKKCLLMGLIYTTSSLHTNTQFESLIINCAGKGQRVKFLGEPNFYMARKLTDLKQGSRGRRKRPRPRASTGKAPSLTLAKYKKLVGDYDALAMADLNSKQAKADTQWARTVSLVESGHMAKADGIEVLTRLKPIMSATVSSPEAGHRIARQIISDFGQTKGLRVFGFGVGYGSLLFFLKNFGKAKTAGVDLGPFAQEFTKARRLGIEYGKSVSDPSLAHKGKFDVTYSILVFESAILPTAKDAVGMLKNMAALTKKGGKSYHVVQFGHLPLSEKNIEAAGFKITEKSWIDGTNMFLSLTKTSD